MNIYFDPDQEFVAFSQTLGRTNYSVWELDEDGKDFNIVCHHEDEDIVFDEIFGTYYCEEMDRPTISDIIEKLHHLMSSRHKFV